MDFIILKVNGQDVSKASHEDALRTFQAAQQPIVVEVLRRSPQQGDLRSDANRNPRADTNADDNETSTVCTQTEPWQWPCGGAFPPPHYHEEDDLEGSLDDPAEPEVDIEEVLLRRASTSERLGLTLYYPDGDDAAEETDVLVQNVESGGLADRDGRIQPGDQILQINGEDVSSKEQAERLLSSRPEVQLLLCRPVLQTNEDTPENENEKDFTANVHCQQSIDNRVRECPSPSGERPGSLEKRDTMKSGSSSGGSSQGSRAAPSPSPTSNLTIDRELYLVNKQMQSIQQQCESLAAQRRPPANGRPSVEDHIYETIPECTESDEPVYSQPYCAGGGGEHCAGPAAAGRLPPPPGSTRSRREVERWIRASVPEPLPEPEPVEAWQCTSSTNDSQSSADSKPARRGRKGAADVEKDSSSAYNTGESNHSAPLTLELGVVADEGSRELRESTLTLTAPRPSAPTPPGSTRDLSLQVNFDSDTYSEVSCKNCRRCMRLPPLQQTPTKNKNIINSVNAVEKNRNYVTFLPYQTHYTNAENLAETMQRQQQQLYQQVMKRMQTSRNSTLHQTNSKQQTTAPFGASLKQYRFVSSPGGGSRNHSSTLPPNGGAGGDAQYQYKVKVRSDGTRYIARRPVRNKLLKEREARINEERAGITTDDDAMSELKLGRYWPRDEKKKQLEKSRERKQKQQQRLKMAALPEEAATDDTSAAKRQGLQCSIPDATSQVQVPRRSSTAAGGSMRRKPHPSVEEASAKHPRNPPKPPLPEPLLSVTTV